mgnify:CR=1 FL=1
MVSIAFNKDCMEDMIHYDDNYFELAIVDPPYGGILNKKSGHGKLKESLKKHGGGDWDYAPKKNYFKELFRISKNQIIWGGNYFINKIKKPSSCWIVWNKLNGKSHFADCELAWTSFNSTTRIYEQTVQSYSKERIHPTQKPVELYKFLIGKYLKDYSVSKIIDTHMGSGSSRIAADILKVNYIGYEINETYYNNQEQRFKNYKAQLNLY